MKLTTASLRQIIKEELETVMDEGLFDKEKLTQQAIDQFDNKQITYDEFKTKLKQIGISAYEQKSALDAARRQAARKADPNSPQGAGNVVVNDPRNQVGYVSPEIQKQRDRKAARAQSDKANAEKAKKLEDYMKGKGLEKLPSEGRDEFIVANTDYPTINDFYNDYNGIVKFAIPPEDEDNFKKQIDKLQQAIAKKFPDPSKKKPDPSKKKPGFFSRFFKEE